RAGTDSETDFGTVSETAAPGRGGPPPRTRAPSGRQPLQFRFRRNFLLDRRRLRLAQHVAAAPHRRDQTWDAGIRQLVTQAADIDVDRFHLRLLGAAIQMIEE